MSRIGKMPISVPAGVDVTVNGNVVTVKGPKGTLTREFAHAMCIEYKDGVITVTRPNDLKINKSLHGLTRTLIHNMVEGVTNGYSKTLEIEGVGYRAAKSGSKLTLSVGYSHPVEFEAREGLTVEVPDSTTITVEGINKQFVGDLAAEIRAVRAPEPYKGKGIRYENEYVARKEGKTGK